MYAIASLSQFVRSLNTQEVCNIWYLEMGEETLEISKCYKSKLFFFFFLELVYSCIRWPYKLMFLFLTAEILDDARIQILQSFTIAGAEVSPFFIN